MLTISINDGHWCYHDPWVMILWHFLKKEERWNRRNCDGYTNGKEHMWPENQEENNCAWRQIHGTPTPTSFPHARRTLPTRSSLLTLHLTWSFFSIGTRFEDCPQKGLSKGKKLSITLYDKDRVSIALGFLSWDWSPCEKWLLHAMSLKIS